MNDTEKGKEITKQDIFAGIMFLIAIVNILWTVISAGIQWIQISRCTEITEGIVSYVEVNGDYKFIHYEFTYKVNGTTICAQELSHNKATGWFESEKVNTPVTLKYNKDNPTKCVVVKEDWDKIYNRIDPYRFIQATCGSLGFLFFGFMFLTRKYQNLFRFIAIGCCVIPIIWYESDAAFFHHLLS